MALERERERERESRNLGKIEEREGLYSKNRPLFICTTKVRQGRSVNSLSGITLIALVITIVVLLILASVSITVVFGDNGILQLAKEAGEKTNEAVQNDKENIANITNYIKSLSWDTSKVTAVTTKDGGIVPIPKGFVGSEVDGENTIKDGFVIYEGTDRVTNDSVKNSVEETNDPRKNRNQFVWVPVEDINDMVYCYNHPNARISYDYAKEKLVCSECGDEEETNFAGKLYANSTTQLGNTFDANIAQTNYRLDASDYDGIRESDILDYYDSIPENLKIVIEDYTDETSNRDTFKTQLQEEFNEMATSVGKYKGFYIGRYETSNLNNDVTIYSQVNKGKVVKGASSICNTNWYKQYVSNKKIGENYLTVGTSSMKVATTSMIWGCQWDATMKWLLSSTDEEVRKYVKDGTGKGNYDESGLGWDGVISTGSNDDYKVNNIYDMAGNVWEWTIEGINPHGRICRGRFYNPCKLGKTCKCEGNYPTAQYIRRYGLSCCYVHQ